MVVARAPPSVDNRFWLVVIRAYSATNSDGLSLLPWSHADCCEVKTFNIAAADPGFPVGGVDLQHGRFLVKMYLKTKKLGPP